MIRSFYVKYTTVY